MGAHVHVTLHVHACCTVTYVHIELDRHKHMHHSAHRLHELDASILTTCYETSGEYTGDHLVRSMCEVVNAFVPIELYESTFGSMPDGNVTCYEALKSIASRDDNGCRQNWSVMQYIENYTGTGLKICATPHQKHRDSRTTSVTGTKINSAGDLAYIVCEVKQIWGWAFDKRKADINLAYFPSKARTTVKYRN